MSLAVTPISFCSVYRQRCHFFLGANHCVKYPFDAQEVSTLFPRLVRSNAPIYLAATPTSFFSVYWQQHRFFPGANHCIKYPFNAQEAVSTLFL